MRFLRTLFCTTKKGLLFPHSSLNQRYFFSIAFQHLIQELQAFFALNFVSFYTSSFLVIFLFFSISRGTFKTWNFLISWDAKHICTYNKSFIWFFFNIFCRQLYNLAICRMLMVMVMYSMVNKHLHFVLDTSLFVFKLYFFASNLTQHRSFSLVWHLLNRPHSTISISLLIFNGMMWFYNCNVHSNMFSEWKSFLVNWIKN